MEKKILAIVSTLFLLLLNFGVDVQAKEYEESGEFIFSDGIEYLDDYDNLTPVDNEISPYATIINFPGPLKSVGYLSNYQLGELIKVRQRQENILNWLTLGLGRVPGANVAVDANFAAGIISGNPLDRMKQAYWTGEHMYVGQYYPTPKPGLSTVPFIYYTKETLIFQ